ncbi:conjugative transposon protein TraK [Chitinophaga sp. Ak27]|uniref:conjugative transposon protein TraK n=1 Tax=Chitinophaga sp. Ak27 TaxID=2726116 RepID=UPI00145F5F34|nr:conjugative transposon protein TraK [Chitinophaga sp. Ak27]NLU94844.1 conjugative transposon protein TraK [Chitinophaga sp. Ak27]
MFKKMQNVDSAFRYIRMVSLMVITGSIALCLYTIYKSFEMAKAKNEKVYVLVNGKALEAYGSERKDNFAVEAKDHIKTFHTYFFTLSPDDKAIEANMSKALYLADESAKRQYDDLKEANYYSNIISSNVNQTIRIDSVTLDMNGNQARFRCYAIQTLTRPTSILSRSLETAGDLREISRSDNNPHGFLIERWKILENKDISVVPR